MKFQILTLFLLLIGQTNAQTLGNVESEIQGGLTDQEKRTSEEYLHQGLIQRTAKEECSKGKNKDACEGKSASALGSSQKDAMVDAVAKMYTMFIGFSDGKLDRTDEAIKSSEDKEKETTDYCSKIPVATEFVAQAHQQVSQNNIEKTNIKPGTEQRERLYQAARTHGARADTAKIQVIGWGGSTACYVGMTTVGGVQPNKKTLLKMAASAVLTAFYAKQKSAHEDYEKRVNNIAKSLPGEGDCNPVTDRNCYCAQPETKNDPQYCLPQIFARQQTKLQQTACVNKNIKADPNCLCQKDNSCFQVEFLDLNSNGGLRSFVSSSNALKGVGQISNGVIPNVNLNSSGGSLRAARDLLLENEDKLGLDEPVGLLTKKQLEEEKALSSLGIPKSIARKLAASPASSKAKANRVRFLSTFPRRNYASFKRSSGPNTLSFIQGRSKRRKSKKQNPDFSKFMKKKSRSMAGTSNILRFGNKAQEAAEISSKEGRPLFEIISMRYKVSGWRRLKLD